MDIDHDAAIKVILGALAGYDLHATQKDQIITDLLEGLPLLAEGEREWEYFNNYNAAWVRVPSEEAAYLNARHFRHRRVRSRTVAIGEWEEATR